ncbi:TonB-dependent receptor [Taibaiella helva]|uniref:TonB-dependent receptor n=1 Tax=Taibaiella helva TaxID=2301235 RepID=UPI000E57C109|nr:TonB-dependent receptor [Taibaiella helva]
MSPIFYPDCCKPLLKLALPGMLTLFSLFPFDHHAAASEERSQIHGKVTTSDGQPAAYCHVTIGGLTSITVDENGNYQFDDLQPGTYTLVVSYVGQQRSSHAVTVAAGEDAVQDFTLSASGQELNEIMIVGNKYTISSRKESPNVARMPLKYLENPQVYSVVDKELIKEQMALTLDESFRNVPGAAPSKTGAGMPAFFSRGFQASENLRNGMATNLRTGIDLSLVERVETIKGPSATLFGSTMTSFGGVVNYITKKPYAYFGGEVSYTYGSFDLSRITADLNTPVNRDKTLLFRINLAAQKENSFQDQGNGSTYVVAPSLTYKVNERLTFSLDADLQHYRGTTPAGWSIGKGVTAKGFDELKLGYKRSLQDNSLVSNQMSGNVYAQAAYKISDSWTSQTHFSWGVGEYNDLFIYDLTWISDSTVARPMRSFSPDKSGRQHIQQNFIGDFPIGSLRNRVVIGADYMSQYRNVKYTYLPTDTVNINKATPSARIQDIENKLGNMSTPENQYKQYTYSAYISDVLNFTDNLMAMASLRVDHFVNKGVYNTLTSMTTGDYSQTALSPKFGLVYQPVKEKIALFANYMNGFKNVANALQPDGSTSVFKPQQANQWEAGAKLALMEGKLSATLSYYDIRVTNAIMPELRDGKTFTVQNGTQQSKGVEAELIASPFPGFNLIAGYGYNDNKFTRAAVNIEGKRALGTPEHVGNVWLTYTLLESAVKGLGIGGGVMYVSDVFQDNQNTFTLPAYTMVDATIFYNRPKYRISFKLNNMLNEKYWVSDGFYSRPQKTRNFMMSVAYKF